MSPDYIGLAVLSVFCAGGFYAYLPQALRLRRLIAAGVVRRATVTSKQRVEAGSESVVHYLVTYEFTDERGETVVREEDLNDGRFFDTLTVGGSVDILQEPGSSGNSHPLGQVRADRRIATGICVALAVLWCGLGAYLMVF